MKKSHGFDGMKILVTGSSRGIGAAIAKNLIEQGAFVFGTSTNIKNLKNSRSLKWLEVDFLDQNSVDNFLDNVEEIGLFDACVNNAGINRIKPLKDISSVDFDNLLDVNLKGPYQICKLMSDLLPSGGKIVNIASIWSVITKEKRSLYTATKAGLAGLSRALAVELGPKNILVNTLSPGFVLTDLTKESLSNEQIENLSIEIPLRRMAQPSEIAEVVSFLVSKKNTYLTGQNIIVDGAYTII